MPGTNLLLVANNGNNIRLLTPLGELEEKNYLYVNSTTQSYPTKYLKLLWLKIFAICHRCQRHRCTLSCEYIREFSENFETAPMGYSGAWGKLIHEKNLKSKISWHCPFKVTVFLTMAVIAVIWDWDRASWNCSFKLCKEVVLEGTSFFLQYIVQRYSRKVNIMIVSFSVAFHLTTLEITLVRRDETLCKVLIFR